jgi:hypothetical protein
MSAPKAVSQRLIGVEAEVLEMALLQLDDGPPETKAYVVERLRQALSLSIPAETDYRTIEGMVRAGWQVRCGASQNGLWTMQRARLPFEFEHKRHWCTHTFPELVEIAEGYGWGPRALEPFAHKRSDH